MKQRILIIDDDFELCSLLSRFLTRNDYEVEEANSGQKGIEKFKSGKYDIVICDYRLGDKDGIEVLKEITAFDPNAIVLIITGYSDVKTAVDVIKCGAYDYITKPLVPDEILNVLKTITKSAAKTASTGKKVQKFANQPNDASILIEGISKKSKELYRQVEIVAHTDYSVILYGESGTGKEVIAQTIHNLSGRRNNPFIALDCGTLSRELSGSELFGHVKGAFTGAVSDKEGHFELANGGTLFLDEVGNLSYEVQVSLLRVIQERKFKRVGGNKEMPLDIRIIVASNENLQDAYKKGKFREDLYHRFNEFSIQLPPLRARQEDIPLFAEFFLDKTKSELDKNIQGIDEEVIQLFKNYSWPGNLREMKNVIRRAALLSDSQKITAHSLPFEISSLSANKLPVAEPVDVKRDVDLKNAAAKAEYEAILNTLMQVNFNKSKAAEILNIDRKTLYNKIRNYEGNFTNTVIAN